MNINVIRTLTVRSKAEGVNETTAALKGLQAAHDGVAKSAQSSATVTDIASKKQLTIAGAYQRQSLALDDAAKMQDKVTRATKVADTALQQGVITQTEHAKRLDLINQKLGVLSNQQKASSVVMDDFKSRLSAATASTGTLGAALAVLGPVGLTIAATIGAAVLAFNAMSDAAHKLAEKAQELRRFSEVTGLTTAQVQALRAEASKFGVTSDEAQTAIQNFTARFNDLRLGQGELLTQIRRVNPALADQMQLTTNAGDALTLFAQGLSKVDDIFQRNALVKAATGRGGIGAAEFLKSLNVDELTKSYIDAGKGLDENLIKKLAQLEIDIKKTSAAASQAVASIFSEATLEAELKYHKSWLEFATLVKNFSISGDLRYLLATVLQVQIGGKGTLLGQLGIDYKAGYKPPPMAPQKDTFAQRFQVATDNPLKSFTPAATSKTLEAQVADMKKLVEVLGPAATASEQLALKQKELALAARDAGVGADVLARAQGALNAEFKLNQIREAVSALGAAATPTEQLTLKMGELDQKVRSGAISQQTMNRAVEDFKTDQVVTALRNNIGALGNAATAAQQYELRIAELAQQLSRGQITQETFNRAVFEANPLVQDLKSSFGDLAKSITSSMLAGKSFNESMQTGLRNLSARLAEKSIEQLLSGDFAKAAVSATSAIVTALGSLLFDDSKQKAADEAKKAWAGMTDQMNDFVRSSRGFDLHPLAQAVLTARKAYDDLWVAAMKAGDAAGADKIASAFVHTVWNQMDKFATQIGGTKSDIVTQMDDLRRGADDLIQSMKDVNFFSAEAGATIEHNLNGQLAILRDRAQKGLIADINEAQGKGFVNELNSLFDRVSQLKSESSVTGVDTTLIDRFLRVQAQKIVDGADLAGTAFDDLVAMFPNLTGLVHESTSALEKQADAQKQLQQELDTAARSIVDYVASFRTGADTTLSPTARLALAQSNYNSQFALAQGGNLEAQKTITQYADPLIKAIKDNFASGGSTQIEAILSQLLTLPALQTSSDPVVQALLDVQQKIGVTNSSLVAGGQSAAQLLSTSLIKLDSTVNNLASVITALVSGGGWLSSLNNLQVVANQQLGVSTAQLQFLASTATSTVTTTWNNISGQSPTSATNNMIQALNKIVVNTYAIARNTNSLIENANNTYARMLGTLAGGGWITGGTPGRDSVPLASGNALGMPGEFVIRRDIAQANKSWLPAFNDNGRLPSNVVPFPMSSFGGASDNSRVEAKLDQLIRVLSAVGAAMVNAETMTGREVRDAVVGAFGELNETIKAEGRHDRGNPQNKKNEAA